MTLGHGVIICYVFLCSDNNMNDFQGKLIEIHFSETGKISGANIQTCKMSLFF